VQAQQQQQAEPVMTFLGFYFTQCEAAAEAEVRKVAWNPRTS